MIKHGCEPEGRVPRQRTAARRWVSRGAALAAISAMLIPSVAHASMFKGETGDKVADVLAWIVMILVPVVGIALFLMVHVIPEKIAEKRHHPQAEAIKTLCLLSLVFGGLLWPLAWLWAFSKPVLYKMAYGTDKLDPHAAEGHAAAAGAVTSPSPVSAEVTAELLGLSEQLTAMQQRIERLAGNLGGAGTGGKGTV